MNEASVDLIDTVQNETIHKLLRQQDSVKLENEAYERKKKFFQEIIHIHFKYDSHYGGDISSVVEENDKGDNGDNGDNNHNDNQKEEKEWRVPRFRLTQEFVQQLVDRLVHNTHEAGSTIAYLRESQTGEVVIPEDMQKLCRSSSSSLSVYYDLFVSQPNKTLDVMKTQRDCYRGGMKFLLFNVPLHSQNTLHQVKSHHIRHWIMDGILCEEPSIMKKKQKIVEIQRNLDYTINRMKKIADEPMFNEKGYELKGKKAEKKREEHYLLLQRDKDEFHNHIDELFEELYQAKKQIISKIYLSILQHDDDKSTWEFMFVGEDKEYFDNIILQKKNWDTSYMYADSNIDIMNLTNSNSDSEYLVDSAGILIKRLEDGFGCYHRRNHVSDDDKRDCDSHVDAYHGTYKDGDKSGYGILYTKSSIYGGKMKNNQPCGHGTLITNVGDVWSGSFNNDLLVNPNLKEKRRNRYARSSPNGQHDIRFADGSFYSGTIENGEITGYGVYVSSKG